MAISEEQLLGEWLIFRYANSGEEVRTLAQPRLLRFLQGGVLLMEEPAVPSGLLKFSYQVTATGFYLRPRTHVGWEVRVVPEADGELVLIAPGGRRDWIKRRAGDARDGITAENPSNDRHPEDEPPSQSVDALRKEGLLIRSNPHEQRDIERRAAGWLSHALDGKRTGGIGVRSQLLTARSRAEREKAGFTHALDGKRTGRTLANGTGTGYDYDVLPTS